MDKDRILQAVLAAEVAKGHLKWKVSEIARFTKVSRPLIYFHFGQTKKEILASCLNLVAEEYYGLTRERAESLKSETMLESLRRTRAMFLKNPALVVFYQRARMQDSDVGRQLVEIEKRYQAKLKASFPQMTDLQIKGVHALFHGMITAPFLDDPSLEAALALVSFTRADAKK